MALGKKIRGLREELGMSQAQLSAQGTLSQATSRSSRMMKYRTPARRLFSASRRR